MNSYMNNGNTEQKCVICNKPLCDGSPMILAKCQHRFHRTCLQPRGEGDTSKCPICSDKQKSILLSTKNETDKEVNTQTKAIVSVLNKATTSDNSLEKWTCHKCTSINPSYLSVCSKCYISQLTNSNNEDQHVMTSKHYSDISINPYKLPAALASFAPLLEYTRATTSASSSVQHSLSSVEKNTIPSQLFKTQREPQDERLPTWECQRCTFINESDTDRCSICHQGKRPHTLTQQLSNNHSRQPPHPDSSKFELNLYPSASKEKLITETDIVIPPIQEKMATLPMIPSTSTGEAVIFIPDLPFAESDTKLEQMIQLRLTNNHYVHVTKVKCHSNIGIGIVFVANENDKNNLLKNIQSTVLDPQTNTIIRFVEDLELISYIVLNQDKKNVTTSNDIASRWQQLSKTSQLPKCEVVDVQFPNIFKILSHSLDELLAAQNFNIFAINDQFANIYLRADCSFLEDLPQNVIASQITVAINAQIGGQLDKYSLYVQYNKDTSTAIILATNAARKWANINCVSLNNQVCMKEKRLRYRLVIHPLPRNISSDLVIQHKQFQNAVSQAKRIDDKFIIDIKDKSVYDACIAVGAIFIENHSVHITPFSKLVNDPENIEINAETWYETAMLDYKPDIKLFINNPEHPIFKYKWNPQSWIEQFKRHEGKRDEENDTQRRLLRVTTMLNTIGVLIKKSYMIETGDDKKEIKLNLERMQNVIYNHQSKLAEKKEISTSLTTPFPSTTVEVINEDCLVVYERLASGKYRPLLLNMANAQTPGGGYRKGAGAQEENLFRRSNYYLSLDMELDEKKQADRFWCTTNCEKKSIEADHKMYPFDEYGAIYTSGITVFRQIEDKGYAYLEQPVYGVCSIALAAYIRPKLTGKNKNMLNEKCAVDTRKKIENLFAIAHHHGHDCLVLSALGCGAFQNPPNHIALIFKSVIEQYAGYFKNISFSIIDDHNTGNRLNPDGNYQPFKKILDGLVVHPAKHELDVNMISGPFRVINKSQGKITIDHVKIFDIPPCRYGAQCHNVNDTQHSHAYSHPPLCPYYGSCDQSTNDEVHINSFIHRMKCQYGGTCELMKDDNHLTKYDHPEFCSDCERCTDMDKTHLMKYRHIGLCKDGVKCISYLKKISEHCRSYRHCQLDCAFGGYCVNFHDEEHINDQTHPFRKPCPLTPFACKYHVEYLKAKTNPSSIIKRDVEEHCVLFSHVCPFGRQCHEKNDLHNQTSIHIARNLCPDMDHCSKLTHEEHLNSLTHPNIHDIRFMCNYPGSECHDRWDHDHIKHFRHTGNYKHIGVAHYSELNKNINFVRNQNELIKTILTYTELHKWKPAKDTTEEIGEWIRALQPVHRCNKIIFESILVHGHVMSRKYMDLLRDAQFVANAVDQHPNVRKIFDRHNNPLLRSYGRDFIRALVAIEFDKAALSGRLSSIPSGIDLRQPYINKGHDQMIQIRELQMKPSLNADDINIIRKHAVRIAEASLRLHANPMGIGHAPDESFGTHNHVFSILGPHLGHYYGDIFIVFKHELMFHPDANFSIQAATTFGQSGNAYIMRPWLKDPGTPETRIQYFHWTKLHCSVSGYEYAAAMELMALTGMKKKTMDVKLKDIQERWMNIDSHQVFEGHLPQLIPLDYIDHVYMPKNLFESLSSSDQRSVKNTFHDNLTITDHIIDLNMTNQLDATRVPYQTYVLNEIKKKIANNNFKFHRGTTITVPASNFTQYVSIPMTISQSFHQYDANKKQNDTIFIYWHVMGGDMMLTVSKYQIDSNKDQSHNPCLICYIADTSSSNDINDYRESYSYITNNHPYSHDMRVQNSDFKAKSKSFHRGCNINDYITYCLKLKRTTGQVTLTHVGANSIYNHQIITYEFDRSELDLFKLDYIQVSAHNRIVPIRNLVVRHEPIEDYHPSFDKDFKEGSEPLVSSPKRPAASPISPKNDPQREDQSLWQFVKDKFLGKEDAPLIPCRDSVNCLLQYSPQESKSHIMKYSHPCRFSELCRSMSDHPHLEHNPHLVSTCNYESNCRDICDPVHRAQYRHSNLPDFLVPCRYQKSCNNKKTEHRVKYSHGEKVPLSPAAAKASLPRNQEQAYGYKHRGQHSPKDAYHGHNAKPFEDSK